MLVDDFMWFDVFFSLLYFLFSLLSCAMPMIVHYSSDLMALHIIVIVFSRIRRSAARLFYSVSLARMIEINCLKVTLLSSHQLPLTSLFIKGP